MRGLTAGFKVGDRVRPKPEWRAPHLWRGQQCGIPSGRVRAIAKWGTEGALYVGDDHRAFAAYVFERDDQSEDADEAAAEQPCRRRERWRAMTL